ncbi:MAG TPA: phytanoyl-CoA dioxygenase family protein [Acidimicrobiia bacterium]|nr:phytanoyl-CoA dioxygenase family protein [Acidimicrobiia bacterium]
MKPSLDECKAAIAEQGYVVLHDVAPMSLFDELEAALAPLLEETPTGRNPFEGHRTRRVNNLLAKGVVFQQVAANEAVLELVGAVLGEFFQVSVIQAIQILPGETSQGFHTDDALYPLPQPHLPVVFNTMWAVDDFTAENGATRLVPGSHRWSDPMSRVSVDRMDLVGDAEVVSAEMPRGSVLAWLGNLLHEGGPNTTDRPRLGITMNYNQSWLRQQENQYLGIPREVVETFPERLQRLVGYDIHPPFIGNVEGRNPMRSLPAPDPAS